MTSTASPNAVVSWIQSSTKLSKVLAAVLTTGYLVQLVYAPSRQYLALVAGRTIPCIWMVVSSTFLEQHIVTLAFSVVALLVLSRVIEPVYGSKEYLKFIIIVSAFAGLGAFITVYFAYALDRNTEGNLLYSEISGFHGVVAGLLVAIKQITPDTEVTLLQALKFRAKHLPALYVLASLLASAILGRVIRMLPFVLCGAYSAWFYLRFLQPSSSGSSQQGDASPEFGFASFFPPPVQPAVERATAAVASLLRTEWWLGQHRDSNSSGSSVASTPPSSTEASRRRERGARALEERLGLKSTVAVAKAEARAAPKDIETGNGDPQTVAVPATAPPLESDAAGS